VDACAAWEMRGASQCLIGHQESTEAAYRNSVALADSGSIRENWLVDRVNLGMFSAAQALYAEIGSPEDGRFTLLLSDGYNAGAVTQAASFIGKAKISNCRRPFRSNRCRRVTSLAYGEVRLVRSFWVRAASLAALTCPGSNPG
jgi:hypothetical protein